MGNLFMPIFYGPPQVFYIYFPTFLCNYNRVYTDRPEKMAVFYSELDQNILDVFNEYNVPILSPNCAPGRAAPAIAPKERWYAPPAEPPEEGQAPDRA